MPTTSDGSNGGLVPTLVLHTTYSLRQYNTRPNALQITNLCYTIIVYEKQDVRKA